MMGKTQECLGLRGESLFHHRSHWSVKSSGSLVDNDGLESTVDLVLEVSTGPCWGGGPWFSAQVDPGCLSQGLVWVSEPMWWPLPCGPLDPADPPSMQATGRFSPGGKIFNATECWHLNDVILEHDWYYNRLIVPRCWSQQSCGISRASRSGTVSPRTFRYLSFGISTKKLYVWNLECFDHSEDDGYSIR